MKITFKGVKKEVNCIEKWGDDDFVTNDEYAKYSVSGDIRYKNFESSIKKGFNIDQLCPMCFKPLTNNRYRKLWWKDSNDGGCIKYYAKPSDDRTPINVGNTCIKHFEEAHFDKYGNL